MSSPYGAREYPHEEQDACSECSVPQSRCPVAMLVRHKHGNK